MNPRGVLVASYLAALPCAAADSDCIAWAQFVEQMSKLPSGEREVLIEESLHYIRSRDTASRYLMAAVNWIESGGTVDDAWRECGSY